MILPNLGALQITRKGVENGLTECWRKSWDHHLFPNLGPQPAGNFSIVVTLQKTFLDGMCIILK